MSEEERVKVSVVRQSPTHPSCVVPCVWYGVRPPPIAVIVLCSAVLCHSVYAGGLCPLCLWCACASACACAPVPVPCAPVCAPVPRACTCACAHAPSAVLCDMCAVMCRACACAASGCMCRKRARAFLTRACVRPVMDHLPMVVWGGVVSFRVVLPCGVVWWPVVLPCATHAMA